ncbi:interactor of HORMAD1 protein 1 isoform X1 [Xyrichtys novacula]|uniref:Interactor of HORMAD1 protein 1 isoform X1 n=1 Tax=Xyrichtys novacula TaxID=13765 RepID=A0AAV1EPK6_XYRNO|nr:interactor of HORMAD1 protein 1 isoform X1 [Xyrichtys novacula]
MSHIRNIKDMLNIQTGSKWNGATSGYSSFTDSQLFFGSQFWPENSQNASQEMSLGSSKTSQHSSQEGSDPKFLSSYHARPHLFGDIKDKSKTFGLLDKFEEDKKKAKEKTDSDSLTKELHYIRETLSNIYQLVSGTEKNTAVCQTILENFDKFASTLQNHLSSLQSNISQQFETLQDKVNSHEKKTTELEERMLKSGESTTELGLNLQSLKKSLECLRVDQEKERNMMEEALKLLSALVAEHSARPSTEGAVDSAIQTSPGLDQQVSISLQENKLENTQLSCMSNNFDHSQAEVLPQVPGRIIGKRKFLPRGHGRRKKRPLVISQRSKHAVTDENSQSNINCNKQQNISLPLCERYDTNNINNQDCRISGCLKPLNKEPRSKAWGCAITPFSSWSQDSSSSVCLVGNEPLLEKPSAESKTATPVKLQSLWQLFDIDSDSF